MSEDITNVAGDDAEQEANNATELAATANSADVQPAAAAPADEITAESAEPVADVTPAQSDSFAALEEESAQETMADWSPTQQVEIINPYDFDERPAPAAPATATTGTQTAEAAQERPRRRDRDSRRGDRGGRNANKRKLDTIQPGEELQGVVRSLQTYGAFVDVGAERDGLVHISELRDGFVEKVEDVVKEGDTVSVRVKEVDVTKGRLSLTMRPPRPTRDDRAPREPREPGEPRPASEGGEVDRPRRDRAAPRGEGRGPRDPEQDNRIKLRDLVEGATLTGKVTSIVDYGAFVDIGAVTDGLVHISEIQDERVNKVSDVLSEGQEVQVRVLGVDKKRNRVSLSMKAPSETVDPSYDYQEEQEEGFEAASPMKDAFDRAREKKRKDRRGGDKGRKSRYEDDVDDIINRTLRWRD